MKPSGVIADTQYERLRYRISEIEHRYGSNVHLLADPVLLTQLAQLCAPEAVQPLVNELVSVIYRRLLDTVVCNEFPMTAGNTPTRMAEFHPEAVYTGPVLDRRVPTVSVNLARAGTLPSHICYTALNYLLDPARVRQDHISIARQADESHQVTGCLVSGHKIGGRIDDAILMFPDPMGATGSTVVEAIALYKELGTPRKIIAMHCIVTPEYLKRIRDAHPEVIVYAARLDRGLSPADVLKAVPGEHWDRERGLNENSYIVPGGGGFGEILNNAFV